MNRRRFLAFLGIAPAAIAAAPVISAATNATVAKLGEWNNYHSVSSPEIEQALKEYADHDLSGAFDRDLARGWVSYKFHYTVAPPLPRFSWKGILL